MILVIEGPNGAGKTTIVDELISQQEGVAFRYIHNQISTTPLKDYIGQACEALAEDRRGVNVVIDRYNVGEQVYPAVYGRERLIEPLEDHMLVQAFGTLGGRWLILCPPVHRLVLAHRSRDEEFDIEILEAERAGFIAYYTSLPAQLKQYFSLIVDDATVPQLLSAVRKLVNR